MIKLKEQQIILQGENVILGPMTEGDWDLLLKWNSDPDVLFFTEGDDIEAWIQVSSATGI